MAESWKKNVCSQLEMWYLHGPDRKTPYEVTLKAVNDLYKEGKFKRFGISNYHAYVCLCRMCRTH
jgi:aflatoxin B1 aldehyde reductase